MPPKLIRQKNTISEKQIFVYRRNTLVQDINFQIIVLVNQRFNLNILLQELQRKKEEEERIKKEEEKKKLEEEEAKKKVQSTLKTLKSLVHQCSVNVKIWYCVLSHANILNFKVCLH